MIGKIAAVIGIDVLFTTCFRSTVVTLGEAQDIGLQGSKTPET
jgi:hypothetical protein